MTDKQRLAKLLQAERALKRTQVGYHPQGVHWRTAMRLIDEVQADLAAPVVPALGPIVQGGKSVLLHDCTHITTGLGWPAFDDGFGADNVVVAPEACVVDDDTSGSHGGDAFYIKGASGLRYWVAHITTVPKKGTRFAKGKRMTTTAHINIGGGSHVHLGIDARPLLGHHLVSHTNYTHGAPRIGVQLAEGMT